jgi:sugar phosphate isomerase/epimerase
MQPAIWTKILSISPFEEVLRSLQRIGWRCVEVATEHLRELREDGSPERIARVRQLLDSLGLEAPQAHAHLSANFAHDDPETRASDLATALADLPVCAALGVRTVVLHPGWSPTVGREANLERNVAAFRQLLERADGTLRVGRDAVRRATFFPGLGLRSRRQQAKRDEVPLRIALENMRPRPDLEASPGWVGDPRFGAAIEDLFTLIDAVGSPRLGICIDTSHAHLAGLDLAQAVRTAAPRLWALHISDNDGVGDLHLHPFHGRIDWLPFLAALREVGFDGPFNLEVGGFARVSWLPAQEAKCRHALDLATLMTSGMLGSTKVS